MTNVVFRADASAQIGTGHVMRCLSLADGLREGGARVTFLSRPTNGHLCDLIRQKGHGLELLPVGEPIRESDGLAHASWLGGSQQRDAEICVARLPRPTAWLVVDHYALDHRWESILRPHVGEIMAIDDLADRRHDCDVLLDQNYFRNPGSRYDGLVPSRCMKLLGPEYALLRAEFTAARAQPPPRPGPVKRIFVFFGGTDEPGMTLKTLQAIASLNRPEIAVDVVLGANNPHRGPIEQLSRSLAQVRLHGRVESMAALMAAADLAVGAGGTSSWERAAMGLPCIVVGLAANQRPLVHELAQGGIAIGFEAAEAPSVEELAQAVGFAIGQPGLRQHLSEQSRQLVDARGVRRVNRVLHASRLTLRRATHADRDNLLIWRNRKEVRAAARHMDPIQPAEHAAWLAETLADESKILLIGEDEAEPVGVIRFDLTDDRAVVSVYLTPEKEGRGYGGELLLAAERWLRQHRPAISVVEAEVKSSNTPSLRAFARAGYAPNCRHFMKALK